MSLGAVVRRRQFTDKSPIGNCEITHQQYCYQPSVGFNKLFLSSTFNSSIPAVDGGTYFPSYILRYFFKYRMT